MLENSVRAQLIEEDGSARGEATGNGGEGKLFRSARQDATAGAQSWCRQRLTQCKVSWKLRSVNGSKAWGVQACNVDFD
ncbi:hypothetical protein BWQ96_04099 [Gracilariopsis chorda]|uniref:Uncharacterized protein n=1 Tax=Gracilariopsis chorda TaxID=448386 RepID=A0A2V3IVH9_9FLOR|nr:hypothetical protein BWQ96_04099 [Gracilariopsis chorda]|eukprot:PXF46093.1 hypothetical protein BWQ96_04099 [Gracilariopsis chorda]